MLARHAQALLGVGRRGYLRGGAAQKMSLNWFMPALVNISVGSPFTTIGAEGTITWPCSKKVEKGAANLFDSI